MGDKEFQTRAVYVFDMAFKMGRDEAFSGIRYFMDCLGNSPEAYGLDMKLWCPHNKALTASMR